MEKFGNYVSANLIFPVLGSDVTITVGTGQGALFPVLAVGDTCQLTLVNTANTLHEIVTCTAVVGDVLTVTRAQEGTVALAWATVDLVELRLTAQGLVALQTAAGSAQAAASAAQTAAGNAQTAAGVAQTAASTAQGTASAAQTAASAAAAAASAAQVTANAAQTAIAAALSGQVTAALDPTGVDVSTKTVSSDWCVLGFSLSHTPSTSGNSLGQGTGEFKFPLWLGGLIVKWGVLQTTIASSQSGSVTYGTAFPNVVYTIQLSPLCISTTPLTVAVYTVNTNRSGFAWVSSDTGLFGVVDVGTYLAIGR